MSAARPDYSSIALRAIPSLAAVLVFCVLTLSGPALLAKQKKPIVKTISGEVLDASENPIVGASVQLSDETLGKKIAIYSEDGGRYEFSDLDPNHDYEVQATYKGVSSEVRKASSLDPRTRVVLNLRIPPPKS